MQNGKCKMQNARRFTVYGLWFMVYGLWLMAYGPCLGVDEGKAGVLFTIGVGARANGMGGAFVGLADDPTAIYWNPAGLVKISRMMVSSMHSRVGLKDVGDIKHDVIIGILPQKNSVIGVTYTELTSGDDFEHYYDVIEAGLTTSGEDIWVDENNNKVMDGGDKFFRYGGTFKDKQNLYMLSYAQQLQDNLVGGVTLKYYKWELFTEDADRISIDVGLLYKVKNLPPIINKLSIGLLLQDLIGTKLKWSTGTKENVPINYKIGAAAALLDEQLNLSIDYDKRTELHLGAEYWLNPIIAARVGYDDEKFTCGASIKLQQLYTYQLDYAYKKDEDLGDTNQITLTVMFK